MRLLRNLLRNRELLSRSFAELIGDWVEEEDVWSFREIDLKPRWLGSTYDFWHYLDGHSGVRVRGPEDIWQWLIGCKKTTDLTLFHQRDYWQHPVTFEQLRKGDCEDHALWAWRKLGELGIPARFFVGRFQWDFDSDSPPAFHAWVTFEAHSGETLVEPMASTHAEMVKPLAKARADYSPHFSIGHLRDTRIYGGFLEYRVWANKNRGRLWQGNAYRPLVGE